MKKDIKTFQGKSVKELEKQVITIRKEIAEASLKQNVEPAKDTNLRAKKRKILAQILTVMNEKRIVEKTKKS